MGIEWSRGVFYGGPLVQPTSNPLELDGLELSIHPWVFPRVIARGKRTPFVIDKSHYGILGVPSGETLDEHQHESIGYILGGDDTLLGDDAGLGKTISIICALNAWNVSRVLIVCPAVVKYNWKKELIKWSNLRGERIHVVEGDDIWVPPSPLPGITIINYDLLVRHKKTLASILWDGLVYDEAHKINNPKSKRTKAALGKKPIPSRKRIFASATSLNKPKHLWATAQACDSQGLGSNWFKFVNKYCDAFRTPYGLDVNGASNLGELGALMRASYYIRHNDSVLKLKPYTENVIAVPRTKRVKATQSQMILKMLGKVQDEETLVRLDGLIKAVKDSNPNIEILDAEIDNAIRIVGETLAEQAQGLRGFVPSFEELSEYRRIIAEDKVEYAKDYLDSILSDDPDGEPILVFCHHKSVVALLAEHCAKHGKVETIDGSVKAAERQEIVSRFQSGATRIIIANLFAGGEGITLTRANRVLFVETDWNATTIRQCFKRVHRRGQLRACLIEYLLMDNSVDIYVTGKFIAKRKIIDEVNDEIGV